MLSLSEARVLGSPGATGDPGMAGGSSAAAEPRLAREKDAAAAVPRKVRRVTGSGDTSGDGIYHLAFLIEKLEACNVFRVDRETRPHVSPRISIRSMAFWFSVPRNIRWMPRFPSSPRRCTSR